MQQPSFKGLGMETHCLAPTHKVLALKQPGVHVKHRGAAGLGPPPPPDEQAGGGACDEGQPRGQQLIAPVRWHPPCWIGVLAGAAAVARAENWLGSRTRRCGGPADDRR